MSDGSYGKAVLEELRPLHRELRHAIPDVYKGFGEFHKAAFAEGALDVKTKELIAFAIGVIERCDGCIASHAEGAARVLRVLPRSHAMTVGRITHTSRRTGSFRSRRSLPGLVPATAST